MEFQVNTNNVILAQINQVESGEYNVTECRFIFSSEYEGLTKIAVFTGANGDAYKITILNNKCEIPSELLTESQIVQIGVYAYEVQGKEFILRYSPMPTRFMIEKGSYVVNAVNMSRPTPTEVEQLQSQITHNANNIEGIQGDIAGINQELVGINGELLGINRDIDDIKSEQTEQNTKIQKNTDDIVEINQNINEIDGHINAINEDIDNLEHDLTNYSLITETGSQINLNVNSTNYQITAILKDKNGNVIYTSNAIDLPIESMIVNAEYDNRTKEIVLTLQNGNTLRISIADLVSGLVSETQLQTILANYYTKTEVDNLLSNLTGRVSTNEEDIADIKEEQTTQNTNIEELQTQVETLQEDLESANAEIAELNTDITNMAKAMYKVDGQGSDITLENTSENKFVEFGLEGRTEQEQLTGKNLLDVPSTFELNRFNEFPINLEAGSYIISLEKWATSGTNGSSVFNIDGTSYSLNNSNKSITVNLANDITKIYMYSYYDYNSSAGIIATFTNLMIRKANVTDDTYEPYCGGIPAPNPIYKIPIKNVTGNSNVKIQNKNMFVAQKIVEDSNNVSTWLTEDGYIRYSTGENRMKIIPPIIKENTSYTIKFIIKSGTTNQNAIRFHAYYTDGTDSQIYSTSRTDTAEFIVIVSTNSAKTLLRIESEYTSSQPTFIKIDGSMILEGAYTSETIPDYVTHKEQNFPFTFAEGQFLADNEKLQDNGMYKKYARVDLSTLTWTSYATNKYRSNVINNIKKPLNSSIKPNILAEKYIVVNQDTSFSNGLIGISTDGYVICMDTTGTPTGILEYELAEEEIIPYNSTQQAQYNAIKQATSYDDITYISSESDELGFNMNVVAVADANKIMQSELQEIKSAVIALGGDINV